MHACMLSCFSPTLCDPMDYSLLDSSDYGIFQARVLEWVAIAFSALPASNFNCQWVLISHPRSI